MSQPVGHTVNLGFQSLILNSLSLTKTHTHTHFTYTKINKSCTFFKDTLSYKTSGP